MQEGLSPKLATSVIRIRPLQSPSDDLRASQLLDIVDHQACVIVQTDSSVVRVFGR